MTGNSSKFFRKNILLATVSSAALLFGGENAFAVAARTTIAPNVNFVTGDGLNPIGGKNTGFAAGSTLQFKGAYNIANATFNILAVDMNSYTTTAFVDNNISIGSIVDTSVAADGKIAASVDARTLTLIGKGTNGAGFLTFAAADNIYTALGDITFNGDPIGIVMVQSYNNVATTLSGNIISNKAGSGTLNLNTDTQIDGTIGATNSLLAVRVGASTATLGGAVLKAQNFNLSDATSVLTLTGAGANLIGSIVNTAAANNGTVNLNGTINIKGNVGTVNALNTINVAGLGAVKIDGTVNTTKFVMKGDNTTAAEVTGLLTGDVTFTADSQLTPTGGITGSLTVDNGGKVVGGGNVSNGVTVINGSVAVGAVTGGIIVSGGTLDFVSGGNVAIIGGEVTAGGAIGGKLAVSNGGKFTGAATDVTGTVTVSGDDTEVTIQNVITAGNAVTLNAGKLVMNDAAGNVVVGGGALTIHNAAGGINFTGNADATVNVANNGDVQDVNNTTPGDGIGILNFTAGGTAGAVGATKSLKEVRFSGAGAVTLGAVKATNINFANAAVVNANGNITANIDFKNNDGVIILATGKNITGTVGSTLGANGTLSFLGSSTVTETIGGAAGIAKLELIQAKGDGGDIVNLNKGVFVTDLKFTPVVVGPASTIKIGGNLTGNVTFYAGDNNGGTLEFNGNAANTVYDFKGAIVANANKGTLNVNTDKLIAYHDSVGTLKQINIQNTKMLQIDASAGDVNVLGAGKAITFVGANSTLGFSNLTGAGAKNILLTADLPAVAAVGGGGKLAFIGGALDTNILNVQGQGGVKNVGDAAGNKFTSLTIKGYVATQDLDLAGVAQLDVVAGANFIDKNNTASNIAAINIGAAAPALNIAAAGAATYTIDANGGNIAIPGNNINFAHADAVLVLQNSSNANNGTITLNQTLNPAGNNEGIVTLNSVYAKRKLTIAAGVANVSLGGANKLNKIVFTGAGEFDTAAIKTNTTDIELNVSKISLGETTANITFKINTQLTQAGNIGGFVDFNNNNAELTLNNGVNIGGLVKNTGGNSNGTIIAAGASTINGPITNIAMLKVGAGAVSITTGGDNSITEIQGTGTDTLTLPENFKLTGSINATGGQAVKLNFKGGTNSISGVVGLSITHKSFSLQY